MDALIRRARSPRYKAGALTNMSSKGVIDHCDHAGELIPSSAQIAEVRAVLLVRPDATDPAAVQIIAQCDEYLASGSWSASKSETPGPAIHLHRSVCSFVHL